MQKIYDIIETVARDLYWKALKDIPADVRAGLQNGLAAEQAGGNATAEQVMFTILENIDTAGRNDTLVCQDTGLPIYKVLVGTQAGIDIPELKARLRRACERATAERSVSSCAASRFPSSLTTVMCKFFAAPRPTQQF